MTAAPDPSGGVFESVLVRDARPLRLEAHLARLAGSCQELYGRPLPDDLAGRVATAVRRSPGRAALRIEIRPAGDRLQMVLRVRVLPSRPHAYALVRLPRSAACWRHKWLDRAELEAAEMRARQIRPDALPYFCAPDDTIAETSRGNLFARLGGVWRTPPASDHLLPGVTRQAVVHLLSTAGPGVQVEPVPVAEFRAADAVIWTSSLSGALPVVAVDGRALDPPADLLAWLNSRLEVEDPAR